MCAGLYIQEPIPIKNYPLLPPFLLCSIFIRRTALCRMHKTVIHPLDLHIHAHYTGINPVIFNTLCILVYNYSLNYTLANSLTGNIQAMQWLYIVLRTPKSAAHDPISISLRNLHPHSVNVPAAAQNGQSCGRRIPRIGGI